MDRKPDVDELWRALGKWGRYQILQTVLIVIDSIPCAFHLLSVVFIGYRPDYACKSLSNISTLADYGMNISDSNTLHLVYAKCQITVYNNGTENMTEVGSVSCLNGYEYNTPKDLSFVTEWDLVCDRQEMSELTQTLIILGQGVGAATLTTFADKYGRKTVHIVSHICILILGLSKAFAPNFSVFAPLRFLTGVAQQGVVLTSVILNIERFPKESRGYMEPLSGFGWTIGCMIIPFMAYAMSKTSWRYLQILFSLWSWYSLIQYWTIDESLRWLVANGKIKEAKKIVLKACKMNRVEYNTVLNKCSLDSDLLKRVDNKPFNPDIDDINHLDRFLPENKTIIENEEKAMREEKLRDCQRRVIHNGLLIQRYTALDIFRSKILLCNSVIIWYAWFVDSLAYYGLFLITSSLAGDRFVIFFLSALVEMPAVFLLIALINRIGRRRSSMTFHAITGIFLLIATVLLTTAGGDYLEWRSDRIIMLGIDTDACQLQLVQGFLTNNDDNLTTFSHSNPHQLIAATAFTMIGKFGAKGSFAAEFCFTPELYPSNLRNTGLGVASALSRLGGMISPFARTLAEYILWGPGCIFGVLCLLVTILLTRLPETRGHALPDSIEELKEWYKSKAKRNEFWMKDNTEIDKIVN